MADHINFKLRDGVQTTDDTPEIITIEAIVGSANIRAEIVVVAVDGTDMSSWHLGQIYKKTDGVFEEVGSAGAGLTTSQVATPPAADWDASFVVESNGDITLTLIGEAAKVIDWDYWLECWILEP